ncbi:DUF4363 family protein [Bacillus cereus]|uniref:DUF4363 family protein n=1 Tax=Bacillus cereus TaxID=1396 RepID=UPI0018F36DFD|nr:DUF4363 family protein [Bacillus cereus]MBJ8056100.1 DUF4363 family protein [Bacillus cereus]
MFNLNYRKFIVLLSFVLFLTGCQQIYKDFEGSIKEIDNLVEQSKWKEASKELKQMQNTYEKKHQWKDFYIEPEDYTLLVEEMGILEGAIKEKDQKQAKIQISTVEALIKHIYYQ